MSDSEGDAYGDGSDGDIYGSDDGGYEFSDGEDEEPDDDDPRVEIENAFVEAEDDVRTGKLDDAVEKLLLVVSKEEELGGAVDFGFKALRHLVTIQIRRGNLTDAKDQYAKLLTKLRRVTANDANDAVDAVLESMSAASTAGGVIPPGLTDLYEQTLSATKDTNERLWFTTLSKLATLRAESGDVEGLKDAIAELHEACRLPSGEDDESKGTQLMEVYALKIQLASLTRDYAGLSDMDERVKALSSAAIVDPRILGIVREAFASKAMGDKDWEGAYRDFYEAFTAFQQAGSPRAVQCLRYTLLANMVAGMEVDPFDSQEAKAYQKEPLIAAMVTLRQAYERDDMARFDAVIKDPVSGILTDPLMAEHLDPLVRNFRARVVLRRVKPYQTVRLSFLAAELRTTVAAVETLLSSLILDHRLHGTIDQISGVLSLSAPAEAAQEKTFKALGDAISALDAAHTDIIQKVAQL